MKPKETEIQKAILDYLHFKGYFVWRNNSGQFTRNDLSGHTHFYKMGGAPGASDIIGLDKKGRFLAIEVKRPGGKTTPQQDEFLQRVARNGGLAYVFYSLDEAMQIF